MPTRNELMRILARVNRRLTNPPFNALATRLPGYAVVVHTGRRTGHRYRTPVGIRWCGNQVQIALNYGRRSDWAQNVLAADHLVLEHRGHQIPLNQPHIVHTGRRYFLRATRSNRGSQQHQSQRT